MDVNFLDDVEKLDIEFKRYLQILKPYANQLLDRDVIDICNAWINRLSNVDENEKSTRNKYVFVLCYQLARGVLDEPFVQAPPAGPLAPICEIPDSDSSTEIEYVVVDRDNIDSNASALFNTKKTNSSEVDFVSQNHEYDDVNTASSRDMTDKVSEDRMSQSQATHKQTIICYTCPQLMKACSKDVMQTGDRYEFRANNLIKRLREIKKENMLLHNELVELKEESKTKDNDFSQNYKKFDSTRNPTAYANSNQIIEKSNSFTKNQEETMSLKLVKNQLLEMQEDKNTLLATIANLQERIDNYNEIKRLEMEDLIAKHKLEIVKIKASLRGESKDIYDDKLEELKEHYESIISKMKIDHDSEIEVMKIDFEEKIKEKEKSNNDVITEKDQKLLEKDKEIATLKSQLEEQKKNLETFFNKISETKANEEPNDSKAKAQELEKRMYKLEKSKIKCAKIYESKLMYMQREKHLAECSLQLQLVRQRAQIINEITDENHSELNAALEKLENKYKDIVANVQSTAIQRRLQDQLALEQILQAVFKPRNDFASGTATNQSQVSGKTVIRSRKDPNQSFESEISGLRPRMVPVEKSFGEENMMPGFCLHTDRLGELFEKVYIPQRDKGEGPLKKV